jgi:hypothetical protein
LAFAFPLPHEVTSTHIPLQDVAALCPTSSSRAKYGSRSLDSAGDRLSGDIDEFSTSAGRGYAPTPPRRVAWGGSEVAVLGATTVASSPVIVRRIAATETDESLMNVRLDDELGRPDWRSMLVELGSADTSEDNATAVFKLAQALATSGERYSLDEPQRVAVVSGRGEFFGKAENAPSGRWHRVDGDGCFPAAVRTGYTMRYVVLSVSGRGATLWQPPTLDVWRWVVVGATLALGDPVLRYANVSVAERTTIASLGETLTREWARCAQSRSLP